MWILFLLLLCTPVYADLYVLTDQTKAVVGLSEQDDMIVGAGQKKDVLKGKTLKDIGISGQEYLYDFEGGKFIPNAKKIADKNQQEQDKVLEQENLKKNRASAIAKIADAISKVEPKDLLTDDEIKALLP